MTRTPRKVTPGFQLSSEQLEQVEAALREMAPPVGTRRRTVAIFAITALVGWLVLLLALRIAAQTLHRPGGPEPLFMQAAFAWNVMLLIPAVGIAWASAFQASRRGMRAGLIVLLATTIPGVYYAYLAFAGFEMALANHRSTAAALGFFFTAFRLYAAAAVGGFVGFLVGWRFKLGKSAAADASAEPARDDAMEDAV